MATLFRSLPTLGPVSGCIDRYLNKRPLVWLGSSPVCVVSCGDIQPESRGAFLKGVEEMQALSSCLLFICCELSAIYEAAFPGGGSPPKSFPQSVRHRPSQGPQSCWLGLSVPLGLGLEAKAAEAPRKEEMAEDEEG